MQSPSLNAEEKAFIAEAALFLEEPSRAMRIVNLLGKPMEGAQKKLPAPVRLKVSQVIEKALQKSLRIAISTLQSADKTSGSWSQAAEETQRTRWTHTASAAASGAAGGLMGPLTLLIELPISTSIMLRGISQVAREWGHDLSDPAVQLQCLYVFTLGSSATSSDDALDSSYLSSRIAFAKLIQEAAQFISRQGARATLSALQSGQAPLLLHFIGRVASRFEVSVSEKMLAKSVPILGSVGGATINAVFCNYFLKAARYHFGLLNLEKKYGASAVNRLYTSSCPPLDQVKVTGS